MTAIAWAWSKISGYLAAAGALIALVLGIWLKGRQAGKAEMRAEQDEKRAEARQVRKDIDDEVDGLGHADLDQRMAPWVRK